MDWKAHFFIGFFTTFVILFLMSYSLFSALILSLIGAVGALLPDMDHRNSKIKDIVDKLVILLLFIYSLLQCSSLECLFSSKTYHNALMMAGVYFLISVLLKPRHRGITHSFVSAVFLALATYYLMNFDFALAIFSGYASHLIVDREFKIW